MSSNRLTALEKQSIDLEARTAPPVPERRWGAVLTADVVEYSRLTRIDEEQTYFLYQSHRQEVLYPKTKEYGARFLKSTGDGIMAEFESALDAARCAIDVQRSMDERSRSIRTSFSGK